MFLEYEHKIVNITNTKDEELKKVKVEKKKIEEEFRSALKEKHLLKDTERILLNTFDGRIQKVRLHKVRHKEI